MRSVGRKVLECWETASWKYIKCGAQKKMYLGQTESTSWVGQGLFPLLAVSF